ncbi:hypothetical protein BDV93DRAFT_317654 [Ceratobasidium sp. AG-I]|nr:hypothetical protein BDV93DRAFT_317654 [Ceratobasidium sp. AG-I]
MFPSTSDDKWGPTLALYLAAASRPDFDQTTHARGTAASNRSARATMEDFLAQTHSFVSVSALEGVLSLARKPANLTEFSNTGMIPACMRILRQYIQDDQKLFRRRYGIMCLDLLLLSFQVGMIAQHGRLKTYAKQWTNRNLPGKDTTVMLSNYAVVAIYNTLYGENRSQNLSSLLGWDYSSTCLPLGGGFSNADALYLLDVLWKARADFVIIGMCDLLPRYLSILFVLWQSLLRMNRVSQSLWKQLHTLVHRYYLFASRVEAVSLHKIAFHLEGVINNTNVVLSNSSLDQDDSRNIIKAYIRRLAVELPGSEVLFINFATCFYDFSYHCVTKDVQELIPELLETSMVRLWREFEDTGPMRHRIMFVIRYAARTFQWAELIRDHITVEALKSSFAQVLFEQDFLNLATRSLFLLYTQEIGHPLDSSVLEEVSKDWRLLHHSISQFSRAGDGLPLVSPTLFRCMYPDWVKLVAYLWFLGASGIVPHPPGYLIQILDSLSDVGRALGFQYDEEVEFPCQSPRCPNPRINGGAQFTCSSCLKAKYCSKRCFNSHWLLDCHYSHRSECAGAMLENEAE